MTCGKCGGGYSGHIIRLIVPILKSNLTVSDSRVKVADGHITGETISKGLIRGRLQGLFLTSCPYMEGLYRTLIKP